MWLCTFSKMQKGLHLRRVYLFTATMSHLNNPDSIETQEQNSVTYNHLFSGISGSSGEATSQVDVTRQFCFLLLVVLDQWISWSMFLLVGLALETPGFPKLFQHLTGQIKHLVNLKPRIGDQTVETAENTQHRAWLQRRVEDWGQESALLHFLNQIGHAQF